MLAVRRKVSEFEFQDLMNRLVGGEDKHLTPETFEKYQDFIMYGVHGVMNCYERGTRLNPEDNSRKYFRKCWSRFEEAKNDPVALTKAVNFLRLSIKWK